MRLFFFSKTNTKHLFTNPHKQLCTELARAEGLYTVLKDSGSNLTAEKTCSHQLWLSTRRKKKNTDDVAMILNMHAVTKQVFTEFLKLFYNSSSYVHYGTVKCSRNVRKTHTGLPSLDYAVDYIIQVTNVHAKICTLRKCNLVIMCNIMHFSTVSTSQLKHFQLKVIQCAAMLTECWRQ